MTAQSSKKGRRNEAGVIVGTIPIRALEITFDLRALKNHFTLATDDNRLEGGGWRLEWRVDARQTGLEI